MKGRITDKDKLYDALQVGPMDHDTEDRASDRLPVAVTAIHLYREDNYVVVAVKVPGGSRNKWIPVIREFIGDEYNLTPFSHAVEAAGIRSRLDGSVPA